MTTKPPIPYMGGKSRITHWLLPHIPDHRRYVELFGGAGALLFAKLPAAVEIYADIDGQVCNLMRVLQDQRQARRLAHRLDETPVGQEAFDMARRPASDPVEQARRCYIRAKLCTNGYEHGGNCAIDWRTPHERKYRFRTYRHTFPRATARLANVEIVQASFERLIFRYDLPGTFYYLDPPYPHETRDRVALYRHEMTRGDHCFLLECCKRLRHAKVMLSSYPNELYARKLDGWRMDTLDVAAHSSFAAVRAKRRTEVLWMNY